MTEPPAAEQCSARGEVEADGRRGIAGWWPQMGGYAGKMVILADPDGCLDVLVWHDGEFPFDGTCHGCEAPRIPARIHVTDPDQWSRLARDLSLAAEKLQ